ncbi:hypothetical protein [Cupriavidus necator]|uniref:hypothetical protein n=1 Tax=Cupriavidus necator TaxID=106590 RepID=UPI0005B4258E|nr:hypothetical protein [Cupriavidus necator]
MKLILNAIGALLALPLGAAAVHKPKPQTSKPGRLTQADRDAIAAAEAKRERKAKKLRRAA